MATATAAAARPIARSRWTLAVLLAAALFINYLDRGNLATAAPLIKSDLHLTDFQVGLLISAFFWIYTPAQPAGGWLVDRLGGKLALGLGFAVWSLATLLTGLASGFLLLLALRVLLGVGETVAFPAMSKLFAKTVPPSELGVVNSVAISGIFLGPAVGVLAGGMLMAALGWRAMFLAFGALALLWLVPWTLRAPGPDDADRPQATTFPPLRLVLRQRALWGASLGHFCNVFGLYFLLSWTPLWLVHERGYSLLAMSRLLAAIYLVSAVASVLAGWTCDRLIAAGFSVNAVRKGVSILGHVGSAVGLLGCAIGSPRVIAASLFPAAACLAIVAVYPIAQTLAGPGAAGRWVGAQNCAANSAGIVGPLVTGWIVDRTGSFSVPFLLAAVVVLLGAAGWGWIIPRVEEVDWSSERWRYSLPRRAAARGWRR
jgi:MFS family permease